MARRPSHNPKPGYHRLLFRDSKGRFVKATERYTPKVAMVQAFRAGAYTPIVENERVTPKMLVDLVTRDEFERLPDAYGEEVGIKPQAKKYKAWDIAGQIVSTRGVRGKRIKIELEFAHGKQRRSISLYFNPKVHAKKVQNQTALFTAITRQLGMENVSEYDKIGSRFLEDRRGTTKVQLIGATISKLV